MRMSENTEVLLNKSENLGDSNNKSIANENDKAGNDSSKIDMDESYGTSTTTTTGNGLNLGNTMSPTSTSISISKSINNNEDNTTSNTNNQDSDTRLWIGNLDSRLREFHLLKMVQRYGTIDNFDLLFHRTGPNIGLPRGYAFVTFQDKEDAEKCLKSLDGTKVLEKHVATTTYMDEETKLKSRLPALSMKKEEPSTKSSASNSLTKEKAINAIEAKLKSMEREQETGMAAGSSSSNFFYQYNKEQPVPSMKQRPRPYDRSRHSHQNRRPYRR